MAPNWLWLNIPKKSLVVVITDVSFRVLDIENEFSCKVSGKIWSDDAISSILNSNWGVFAIPLITPSAGAKKAQVLAHNPPNQSVKFLFSRSYRTIRLFLDKITSDPVSEASGAIKKCFRFVLSATAVKLDLIVCLRWCNWREKKIWLIFEHLGSLACPKWSCSVAWAGIELDFQRVIHLKRNLPPKSFA